MANYFFFDGIANWAQVQRPNKFGAYSINLVVDAPTRKAVKQTGAKLNVKETDEGEFFYTFRRKATLRKKNGEVVEMDPPTVTLADGTPYTGLIGNGSKVTVKVEVYEFQGGVDANGQKYDGGKGTRLVGVRINELVEYKKEENTSDNSADMPF